MHHNLYHMPQPSTMYINNVPIMYLNHNHIPYHSIMSYAMYHRIYQESTINGVPQPSTNMTKRCISYLCFHIPSVILNNVSISMTTIHHVPVLQEYTKNKPQAYSIISMYLNQIPIYQYNQYVLLLNVPYQYHQDIPCINKTCFSSMYHTITKHKLQSHQHTYDLQLTCCTITLTCNSSTTFSSLVPTFPPNFP
jgi:hypothetical protein